MRLRTVGGLAVTVMAVVLLSSCLPNGGADDGTINGTDNEDDTSGVLVVSYDVFSGLTPPEVWNKIEALDYEQIPLTPEEEYYSGVDSSTSGTLRTSLHPLISGQDAYGYTETGDPRDDSWTVDVWDILMLADQHPEDETKVLDLYKNGTYDRVYGGTAPYNREHSWPKTRGFDSESSPAYTDCHHLFACDSNTNSTRNDSFFGSVNEASASSEVCTDENLGLGGSTDCNYGTNTDSGFEGGDSRNDFWEVWSGRRGDVARAMFYMAIRCEGDAPKEPDLKLTSQTSEQLVSCKECYLTGAVAYMGLLDVLLEWHEADPVDDHERRRNTIVYLFQGNRNPFVDHPEWVNSAFGEQ